MSIHEIEPGRIVGRQDGTLKEFKEEFYEYFESNAVFVEDWKFQAGENFPLAYLKCNSYERTEGGFECDGLTLCMNKRDLEDNEELIPYFKRHEVAEFWTLLKPGFAIEKPITIDNDKVTINIESLNLTHGIGMRQSFRLAVSESRGREFFDFLEGKIRKYYGELVSDNLLQKSIQEQRLALEKAEDEKARGVLK